MNVVFRIAVAFAAGLAAMYYMDPAAGRRRRALARDRSMAFGHEADHYVRAKSKRATDRLRGAIARTRANLSQEPVDDDLLHDRIRSRLGRLVDHPGAVEVQVREGHVVLKGFATTEQADNLVEALLAMRGVQEVDNRLSSQHGDGRLPDSPQHVRH